MAQVKLKHYESFNSLMRRFKKRCDEDKIIQECRDRKHFEKPSVVKKKERIKAVRRTRMKMLKEQEARERKY